MTKVVGKQIRTEFILNPGEAFRRGELLDRMLRPTVPARARGVSRGTHAYFNQVDAAWQLEIAKRLNAIGTHGR
ncbi:MAG: hypothetical protein ACRCV9_12670 [Burkholderiaceae bacterium]